MRFRRGHRLLLIQSGIQVEGQHGFTLTELAVVVAIIAIMIGGMLIPLSAQDNIRRIQETEKTLRDIQEALLGFAASNGRLPCADTDLDGVEDCTPTVSSEGGLPYATLGVTRIDSWGSRFRYIVDPAFAVTGFTLASTPTLYVKTRGDDPSTPTVNEQKFASNLAAKVPAIVISHGANGSGATTEGGLNVPISSPSGADETANASDGTTKWSRLRTPPETACSDTNEDIRFCQFDDLVAWLSPNILYNRMIAAGRLP
jgi:prepilin-type N-terminal cleavage/methylation domain-containing protein